MSQELQELPRVIIEVRGGMVQCIRSSDPVSVSVLDWDNIEGDDQYAQECEQLQEEAEKLEEIY
jgi:hypothetical protein